MTTSTGKKIHESFLVNGKSTGTIIAFVDDDATEAEQNAALVNALTEWCKQQHGPGALEQVAGRRYQWTAP